MLINEVLACSFSSWYKLFSHLTFESQIYPINDEFKEYLLARGTVILPECCNSELNDDSQNGVNNGFGSGEFSDDEDDDDDDWWKGLPGVEEQSDNDDDDDEIDDENQEDEKESFPEFPVIEKNIRQCLRRYGQIFPKLNWSACDDSRIQAFGTKCSTMTEVFLLLKTSDKIVHDLTQPFNHCTDFDPSSLPNVTYDLVLRRWHNMNPSMEFRCFIASHHVIGISQRDTRSYYEYITKDRESILDDILRFFTDHIAHKFTLDNYVIDVFRPAQGRLQLVDVNPFGESTNSLLFDWDELRAKAGQSPTSHSKDFRFIDATLRRHIQTPFYEANSVPTDVFTGNLS